jgi:CubicO group peptidase (beta-lactamase class C family)
VEKPVIRTIAAITVVILVAALALTQTAMRDGGSGQGLITDRLGRIDSAIDLEVETGRIPGAVALIMRDGKLVYLKSFGFADIEAQTSMQVDSIFRIASMTKAITSVAAMVLYEQGRFRLNDPVAKYIPEFARMNVLSSVDSDGNVTATVPATKPIRIVDLMTHASGIGYPFIPSKVQKSYHDAEIIDGLTVKPLELASQMKRLATQPLLFEPGSAFAYGLSTDLLGYLIEVVSGKSLDRFLAWPARHLVQRSRGCWPGRASGKQNRH